MGVIMKILGNLRLRTKIIVICVVILLLNSIICGSLYYHYVFKDTLKNYYSSSEDMVSQMRMQLTTETQSITKRVHAIFNNMSFYMPISQYLQNQDTASYVKLLSDISDVIMEFDQGDRYIHSVSIETDFGSFDNFTRIRDHEFHFMESDMREYFILNPNESICWYPAMVSPIYKSSDTVIPVVYRFTLNRREIYVVVSLQQSEIEKFLKNTYRSYDKIFIADSEGANILNCGEAELQILGAFAGEELGNQNAICKEVKVDGQTYLATYTEDLCAENGGIPGGESGEDEIFYHPCGLYLRGGQHSADYFDGTQDHGFPGKACRRHEPDYTRREFPESVYLSLSG